MSDTKEKIVPPDMRRIIKEAVSSMKQITGLELSTVTGVARDGSNWRLSMELVEKTSIPAAMDILGEYEVLVDKDGRLLSFDRKGLRHRGDTPRKTEEPE